jgi:hypothetical protein
MRWLCVGHGVDARSVAHRGSARAGAGFTTGEWAEYDVLVPSAIGRLKGIRVLRDEAEFSSSCSGWFLERVRRLTLARRRFGALTT